MAKTYADPTQYNERMSPVGDDRILLANSETGVTEFAILSRIAAAILKDVGGETSYTQKDNSPTIPYSSSGYYDLNGVFYDSTAFKNTGLQTINGSILLYTQQRGANNIATLLFYDINDTFISAIRLSVEFQYHFFYNTIPAGAVKFIALTATSDVTSTCQTNTVISIIEKLKIVDENIKDLKNSQSYVNEGVYAEFLNVGWYSTGGVFTSQSGFVSTDKMPIPNAVLLNAMSYGGNIADVCFFDITGNFLSSLQLNDGSDYKVHVLTSFPENAATFTISKAASRTHYYARIGDAVNASNQFELLSGLGYLRGLGYRGTTALCIGDSLSTLNNYFWKGFMNEAYGIDYVSYSTSQTDPIPPAVGGIPVMPHDTEGAGTESIWYRCSNQRLLGYNFDFIIFWGGTNDLGDDDVLNYDYGTKNDAPYLDTDGAKPVGLTWASAYKGCIEMLQRDFPDKEIVLMTVYNANYGIAEYKTTGYSRAEYIARLQMEIAEIYGLKIVPLYWMSGIDQTNWSLFLADSVHPNKQGARRILATIADTLSL